MQGTSDRITHQHVSGSAVDRRAVSFVAARTPAEFVSQGFLVDSAGASHYLGPDADIMLDEAFAQGYCFRIAEVDRARRRQVGLSFSPARRQTNRSDIDGTVWIDTVAR